MTGCTGTGLSGVNGGAPGPGFLLAFIKCRNIGEQNNNTHHDQPGFESVKQRNSFFIMQASVTGNSSLPAFFSEHRSKKDDEEKQGRKGHDDSAEKASMVVGTHSGVNNSFFGFR